MGFLKIFRNFGNAEATREAMRMSYRKHFRGAIYRGMADDSPEHVGLYGALGSRYKTRGLHIPEPALWAELSPFLLMDANTVCEALAEYVVYQERPGEANVNWLRKLINDALRRPAQSEESPRTSAPLAVINGAPWARLLLDDDLAEQLATEAQRVVDILESE